MKKHFILFIIVAIFIFSCVGNKKNNIPRITDMEIVGDIINFSLVKSDNLDKYINNRNEDYYILEKIYNYNDENDKTRFSSNENKNINKLYYKKRLLILMNNM